MFGCATIVSVIYSQGLTLMRMILLCLITLGACSTTKEEDQQVALEEWKGHETEELKDHPYFGYLPLNKKKHPDGRETWIFRDQSRYQSRAYCESLGGCMGMPYYNCDTAFSVKDHVIEAGQQNGTCPPVTTIEVQKK